MNRKILLILVISLASIGLIVAGCQNLDVTNLNNPDEERAQSTPTDIESLISGTALAWWQHAHYFYGVEHIYVTGDEGTCSWGNYSMKQSSSEPRAAWPNEPSYNYNNAVESPWARGYRTISSANDGLRQIAGGLEIGVNGADTPRAKAFAKLMQGLAHAQLAIYFDQAFIFDENVDLESEVLELQPYELVMAAAKTMIEEAIALCEGNTFTTDNWFRGLTMTNTDLAKMGHSYLARYMAQVARSVAEGNAADWNTIKAHAQQGFTEIFAPVGDGGSWDHSMLYFHNDRGVSWARMDYKLIGPSDKSGKYQAWLDASLDNRTEFDMDTDDKRLWDGTLDADGNQNPGSYAGNWGNSPFRANRGLYHFSRYGWYKYEAYRNNDFNGPMQAFLPEENDFLIAEALLRTGGSLDEVAGILNNTRVTNGGYDPVTAAAGAGSPTDPRSPLAGASLFAMLKYEKGIELLQTGVHSYYDRRRWGSQVKNTPIHFPVPGKELQIFGRGIYTFGGGGIGSSPKIAEEPKPKAGDWH